MKEQLARSACDFLSEMLRTRRVSLERGAEIAHALEGRLQHIQSEDDFLTAVRELEFEFQELKALGGELQLSAANTGRESMESLVREYAAATLPRSPKAAVAVMEEALLPNATLDWLLRKFPEFNQFYEQRKHGA